MTVPAVGGDVDQAHRAIYRNGLWLYLAVLVSLVFIFYGAGFLYGGSRLAAGYDQTPLETIPGALRTHGVILMALGAYQLYVLPRDPHNVKLEIRPWVRTGWILDLFYATWVFGNSLWSWHTTGRPAWNAPFVWVILAGVIVGLMYFPPVPNPEAAPPTEET